MEAKVDIRKLQLLNDRINQTIEALNQVRFSVHGLHHSSMPFGWGGQWAHPATMGYNTMGYNLQNLSPFGWGQLTPGISHSNPMQQIGLGQLPFGQVPFAQAAFAQNPFNPITAAYNPWNPYGGISHTSVDPTTDPYWNLRVVQTFPFAPLPFSPTGY
jgi:hypothetical protein